MLFAEPPVPANPFIDPDVRCTRCVADANARYFNFVQRVWHDHQVEASRQSAAIVRRIMHQNDTGA